jgi:cytosine/adenosine deaminase-related metal-dependent hydrolase
VTPTTVIADADWIVGFDGAAHRLIRHGTLAFCGNTITFVGRHYEGPRDIAIDGRGKVVMPGLINMHAHMALEARTKGFSDDHGSRKLWMSGLPEYLPAMGLFDTVTSPLFDREGVVDSLRFALAEAALTGTTSVFDIGWIADETLAAFEASGLRVFNGPVIRCGRWWTPDGHSVKYEWDLEAGRRIFRTAVEYIERRSGDWGGRLTGVLIPAGPDTLEPELIPEIMKAAQQLRTPLQIHVAQTVHEHLEMIRRHGQTSIEFLARRGMVGPQVILGHAIYLAHHSAIRYFDHDDLGVIADSGTHVVYCPWNFARRGRRMESFGGYLRRGVNVSIGTDTCPHDMTEEMRWAAIVSKVTTDDAGCPTAAETFTAATLGAARALGRDDLGRLAPGARADLVILDGATMAMRPLRDPIKNVVYYGGSRSVETVIVDGRTLVRDGQLVGVDTRALGERVQAAAERALAHVHERDWARRTHEQMAPLSFAPWEPA